MFVLTFSPILGQQETIVSSAQDVTQPESYLERIRQNGAVLELSLRDAIRLALSNNLEIAIEEFNEDLNRERIIDTRGFYDPVLDFRFGWQSNQFPNTSSLDAGRGILARDSSNLAFGSSVRQNVPGGGNFAFAFDNSRGKTNSTFRFINPRKLNNR